MAVAMFVNLRAAFD